MKNNILLVILISVITVSNTNIAVAQDLIGHEWLACNVYEDSTYFKFENDTIYVRAEGIVGFEEFIPVSIYNIENDIIDWNDIAADQCDPLITGTYTYNIEMDVLSFGVIEDACDFRLEILSELILKRETIISSVQNEVENINIFPNPVSDRLTINGLENAIYSFTIYDQIGRKIQSGWINGQKVIDTENLKSGNYILRLVNSVNQASRSFKIIRLSK